MRWRRSKPTIKPCPAPDCTTAYEECYTHRADEAVWDYLVAHGEQVRAARAKQAGRSSLAKPAYEQVTDGDL